MSLEYTGDAMRLACPQVVGREAEHTMRRREADLRWQPASPKRREERSMLITNERQRLIECVHYFASRMDGMDTAKLFRLLYLLDFIHCRETGRSVTELEYFAEATGPKPRVLAVEIVEPSLDWAGSVRFEHSSDQQDGLSIVVSSVRPFKPWNTSRRQRELMKRLCQDYHDKRADQISEDVEFENPPWERVFHRESGCGASIPYEYAFRSEEFDLMSELRKEHLETVRVLRGW